MKRLSAETFVEQNMGVDAVGIRIENGEINWLFNAEEWPDCPDFNKEGMRIFAPHKGCVLLNRDLVFEGCLDVCEAEEYECTPMVYYYDTEEECEAYKNISENMLELVKTYTRNGNTDPDDYDIFLFSEDEFISFFDALRDGDYIIIIERN